MRPIRIEPKTGFVRNSLARLLLLAGGAVLLAPAALCADSNGVVVQVGKQSVSLAELQRRWLELPAVQRQALGKTDGASVQAYVDRFVVPELLLAEAASQRTSVGKERQLELEKPVLQRAMADQVRKESEKNSPVTDADIRAYFESRRREFERPERVRLYRILVASEAEALEIIKKAHEIPDFDAWRTLAREKSLDKATNMRGGELGFVSADGQSDVFELQVDPALFAAAAHVKDGELVTSPVREKDKFAAVWRRGHVPAERATLSSVSAVIQAHLREERAQKAFDELVAHLREKYVKELNPSRLEGLDFGETPGDRFQAGPPEKHDTLSH